MDLLQAIQKDDLKEFELLIQSGYSKRVSFGRFPILSVCYLYSSKKIIKKYEKELLQLNDYEIVDENNEIYIKFKSVAKRVIRIYAGKNTYISPLEMLLILGKTNKLADVYKDAYKNNVIQENLSIIQKIKTGDVLKALETRIEIPKLPLTKKTKRLLIGAAALFTLVIVLSACMLGWFNTLGVGTINMPLRVYNDSQFISYINKGVDAIILDQDIEIDSINIDNLNTKIDGNGKSLILKNQKNTLFNTNNSTITNLNIKVEDISIEIEDNFALLTLTNNGTISNVTIEANLDFVANGSSDEDVVDIYVSIYCYKNYGSIENCSYNSKIEGEGNSKVNTSISVFCGINYKDITKCSTGEKFSIKTQNVDIGAVSALNMEESNIVSCKVLGSLEQNGIGVDWNPNVAGVSIENSGYIKDIKVSATITCTSDANDKNSSGYLSNIYTAGIVCINAYGGVEKSMCDSKIYVNGNYNYVYVGGIAAINYLTSQDKVPVITQCAARESVVLDILDSRSTVYAGGVCGADYGVVSYSYCIGELENKKEVTNFYSGAIVGVISSSIYQAYLLFETLYIYENVFFVTDGFYSSVGQDISSSFCDYAGKGYSTIEEVKNKEVYWE